MKGLFKNKPRTPAELVRHVHHLLLLLSSKSDIDQKREEKYLADLSRTILDIRTVLYGNGESEPIPDACSQVTQEFFKEDTFRLLVLFLLNLPLGARQDATHVIANLQRQRINSQIIASQYLEKNLDLVDMLINGYEQDGDIALTYGAVARECIRHQCVARHVLGSDHMKKFFDYIQLPNFEIASDALSTFKELLTRHKSTVSEFLSKNYDWFFEEYNTRLLESNSYFTRRLAIKLLADMLLDRSNSATMVRYVSSVSNMVILMNLLRENTIAYWRKFVAEYYSPRARERWCLSLYNNVGHHALGVFPQASMDAWQCDICGSKSGRGFEATFEVLPRLSDIKFGSGVIDELLFLDLPREQRFPSGLMMLEYAKAVQESVYEQLRVVREGHLRIIFTQDLKILSWEFCAKRHEELLPRRLVAPQVNQLVQVAQKCQSTVAESGPDGVSQQDLQTNSNMVLAAGRQLAKSLELQSVNDLGFSKRYVRCLQISEVVNSMKDLMDICREHKIGPMESLKTYPRFATPAKLEKQKIHEMEQLANAQGLPTERNTLNKLMALNPGLNNPINNNLNMGNRGALSGSAQAALAMSNYPNLLIRQNSMNSSPGSIQREGSSSFNNANQSPSSAMQGAAASAFIPGSMQNSTGFPSPHLPPQQRQQHLLQRSASANGLLQQNHSQGSQGNQALQQQMIQQLLMSNNNGGVQSQSLSGPNANGNIAKNGLSFGGHSPTPSITGGSINVSGNNGPVSRSNSFKVASNSDSSAAGGNNGINQRTPDMPQNILLQDVVPDIVGDFTDSPFFNSDLDDNMGFGWKA